jgi:hypothetical protein
LEGSNRGEFKMKSKFVLIVLCILIISTISIPNIRNIEELNSNFVEYPDDDIEPKILKSQSNGYFTENLGQVGNDSIKYYIIGNGIWFLENGFVLYIREPVEEKEQKPLGKKPRMGEETLKPEPRNGVVLKLLFVGCNNVVPEGRNPLGHKSNFFYGSISSEWRTEVSNYKEIYYRNIYNGIDLKYYFKDKELKYDFFVYPGAKVEQIRMKYEGANDLEIDQLGNLVIETEIGDVIENQLYIYQDYEGEQYQKEGNFLLFGKSEFGYEITEEYHQNQVLVIDPVLEFSTFIGWAREDRPYEIAVDTMGNSYITGKTHSEGFPTTPGAYDETYNGDNIGFDIFTCKLNENGSDLMYSTYIGGGLQDFAWDLKVDDEGNAYLTGATRSFDFPTTTGSFDTSYNSYGVLEDAFILKLNKNGSALIYSTFIGGTHQDFAFGIAIDNLGNVYVTGDTLSPDFPTTTDSYDESFNGLTDIFVLKLDHNGSKLLYSTLIGGSGWDDGGDIEIDSSGNAYITGSTNSSNFPVTPGAYDTSYNDAELNWDVIILKLNQDGTNLLYSTFVGGDSPDECYNIALDSANNVYVAGMTKSTNFPTTPGAYNELLIDGWEAFVLKLNQAGSNLVYSTYISGTNTESPRNLAVDIEGNAYVVGYTNSPDFPITVDAFCPLRPGDYDAFLLKLDKNGSFLHYSTFIGGSWVDGGYGVAIDLSGNIYICGSTRSLDFPTIEGSYDTSHNGNRDCFVMKFDFNSTNNPPIISSFTTNESPEGSEIIFNVIASDVENDTLTYSFDFEGDGTFDAIGINNTASHIWGDDYIGEAIVHVSDGEYTDEAKASVIVKNVDPTIVVESVTMEVEIGLRIAGRKFNEVSMTLFEEGNSTDSVAIERMPGSPDDQMVWIPATLDMTKTYSAIVTYTPKDPPNVGGNPVWLYIQFPNGSVQKIPHTFNVQQSKKRDSDHWNHVEPWEVDLNVHLIGWAFDVDYHVTDPGSDDENLSFSYGSQKIMISHLNNPPFPDPYPSPEINPRDINGITKLVYEGPGTLALQVEDDDGGEVGLSLELV